MKKSLKNTKGITLIVLVITIIILLILSGITIQSITHTGIFKNAKQAQLENKRAQIIEYLKLKLLSEQTNNPLGSAEEIIKETRNNILENIDDLKKIGREVTIEDTSTEEDGEKVNIYFYVVVDKDVYKVELNDITFIGELGKFLPIITLKSISNTTSTITVEVETKRNQGGILEYYIKSEYDEEYKLIKTTTEEKHTYEELEQGKKYSIKVIAIAENKKKAEVITERTIGSIEDLTEANAKFTYNPNDWTNTEVIATISTDIKGYTIQTSKDGKTWLDTPSQTMSNNGAVYARLWDGTNAGGMLTGNVTKIDKKAPTFTINATSGKIGTNGTIAFDNIVENESGILGYYIGQDNPTTTNVSFGESTSRTINKSGIWYLAIKDNAGNVSNVQSIKYYTLTLNSDGASNYTSNSTFIKEGTTITLPTGLTKSGAKANTWAKTQGTTSDALSSVIVDGNINLYPVWKITTQVLHEGDVGTAASYTYTNDTGKYLTVTYTCKSWSPGTTQHTDVYLNGFSGTRLDQLVNTTSTRSVTLAPGEYLMVYNYKGAYCNFYLIANL